MSDLNPLLTVAALLLIPLVPAAVLYKVLTPGDGDNATGDLITDAGPLGKVVLKFNVVGSTATYVVLLAVSILVYMHLATLADKEADRREAAMRNNAAWIVETPIGLQNADGSVRQSDGTEMQQIRIDVAPALTMASAKSLTFRVLANEGKFPTARFNLPGVGLKPVVLDLNDPNKVRVDFDTRRIDGIEPVWIVVGKPYGAGNEHATALEVRQ